MTEAAANVAMALDVRTLFVVATCITALLGLFLLFAWRQDRVRALGWWGTAYLIGGFSVVIWSIEGVISPPLPAGIANALLFVACGMIWNAARVFHGRRVLWPGLLAGAAIWLVACVLPAFVQSSIARMVLSSLVVSAYTFLTASELWRERRKTLQRRWPAIFVPILHGAVFLFPIPLAGLLPSDVSVVGVASAWTAIFALETMLYVVGTAFIVLALAKDRVVRIEKDAASTDELTGIRNRRGFLESAKELMQAQAKKREPVSVLIFDLDLFKSINDRFGHAMGDEVLRVFGHTVMATTRESDLVCRFGGEEFVALVPSSLADALVVGERVRAVFEEVGRVVGERELGVTVSVGAACGQASDDLAALLVRADAALYRAKEAGRNRIEGSDDELPTLISTGPAPAANRLPGASLQPGLSSGKGVLMAAPASGG